MNKYNNGLSKQSAGTLAGCRPSYIHGYLSRDFWSYDRSRPFLRSLWSVSWSDVVTISHPLTCDIWTDRRFL